MWERELEQRSSARDAGRDSFSRELFPWLFPCLFPCLFLAQHLLHAQQVLWHRRRPLPLPLPPEAAQAPLQNECQSHEPRLRRPASLQLASDLKLTQADPPALTADSHALVADSRRAAVYKRSGYRNAKRPRRPARESVSNGMRRQEQF